MDSARREGDATTGLTGFDFVWEGCIMTTMAAAKGASRRYSSTRLLLDKLERNRSRNLELLSGSVGSRQFSTIQCDRCGLEEPVHFWTPIRRRGATIHLRCPSGCETRVRYDLGRDRVARERDWIDFRPRAVLLITLAVALAAALLVGSILGGRGAGGEEVIGATADTNQRSAAAVGAAVTGSDPASAGRLPPPGSQGARASIFSALAMIASRAGQHGVASQFVDR